jgi:hypothetical protein
MGMVYAAMHELTGRRVAIKVMLSDTEDGPMLHDRFLSEARIAATVRHPNIVDVLDMGLHGGAPFIVMELLEGMALEQVLEQQKRLTVEQALMWLLPIIGALAVLHEAGIVHRDVKPSNIFMSSLPRHPMRPKLLDFGLARVVSDLRLTRSGTVIGTPLYMAPEHAAGLSTGAQADVWSIGVVLFECLSGCSPFNYVDRSSLALQVLAGLVRPLAEVRPDLPPAICSVVNRALQRDLSRRYPDMRSLAHALHAAAQSSGIPLPADPDPIGLPDYVSWQRGAMGAATTHEHITPAKSFALTPSFAQPAASAQRPVDLQRTPQPEAGYTTDQSLTHASSRTARWWSLGLLAALLAVGAWWLQARRPAAPVALAPLPEVVTPAPRQAVEPVEPAPKIESLTGAASAPAELAPEAGSPATPAPTPAASVSGASGRRRGERVRRALAADAPAASAGEPRDKSVERSPAVPSKPASGKSRPGSSPESTDEVESEWK